MRKRYPSDMTDAQWQALQPLIPLAKPGGRPRQVDMREVLNTLFYKARTGCQWDYLPHDLLPKSIVRDYFDAWQEDGTWQRLLDALRPHVRQAQGREPTPRVAYIDSQSVKATEMGGPRGYDAGKKIKGRKRHIVVDSLGLLLAVAVTSAKVDDGTAALQVLKKLGPAQYPRLEVAYGDGRYNNRSLQRWLRQRRVSYRVETVCRPKDATGFVLLPKRWVVEWTFAWLGRYRQLSKEYDYEPKVSTTWIQISALHLSSTFAILAGVESSSFLVDFRHLPRWQMIFTRAMETTGLSKIKNSPFFQGFRHSDPQNKGKSRANAASL